MTDHRAKLNFDIRSPVVTMMVAIKILHPVRTSASEDINKRVLHMIMTLVVDVPGDGGAREDVRSRDCSETGPTRATQASCSRNRCTRANGDCSQELLIGKSQLGA